MLSDETIRKALEVGAKLELRISTKKAGVDAHLTFSRKDFDAEQWAALCEAFALLAGLHALGAAQARIVGQPVDAVAALLAGAAGRRRHHLAEEIGVDHSRRQSR